MPQTIPLSVALAERQRHSDYEAALDTGSLVAPQAAVGNNGSAAKNGSLTGVDADDSVAGTGLESDAEKVRTHSQLTAGGKKVNKKSRNIRANKRGKDGDSGAVEEMAESSDLEEADDVVRRAPAAGLDGDEEDEDEDEAERDPRGPAADEADSAEEDEEDPTAMEVDR